VEGLVATGSSALAHLGPTEILDLRQLGAVVVDDLVLLGQGWGTEGLQKRQLARENDDDREQNDLGSPGHQNSAQGE
jgi:hypothetical protein